MGHAEGARPGCPARPGRRMCSAGLVGGIWARSGGCFKGVLTLRPQRGIIMRINIGGVAKVSLCPGQGRETDESPDAGSSPQTFTDRASNGRSTKGAAESQKVPRRVRSLAYLALVGNRPNLLFKSRICKMRHVVITWRVFYSVFLQRCLVAPHPEHDVKARHPFSAPRCVS